MTLYDTAIHFTGPAGGAKKEEIPRHPRKVYKRIIYTLTDPLILRRLATIFSHSLLMTFAVL